MTFDEKSALGRPKAPATSPNSRTPSFDLDPVYGAGPADSPQLYDPNDPIKFQVETGGLFEDLPRDPVTSAAIIADPRNDENLISLACRPRSCFSTTTRWTWSGRKIHPFRTMPPSKRLAGLRPTTTIG